MRGKPIAAVTAMPRPAEHPRVCGENSLVKNGWGPEYGTSPRMRRKQQEPAPAPADEGNIPAYAGKTPVTCAPILPASEHPRVCGENLLSQKLHIRPRGTSPRMRGKPAEKVTVQELKRNIPAYAGKTTIARCLACCHQEHPRVCGENCTRQPLTPSWLGTSPRMRGKLKTTKPPVTRHGNIPAYAGKTDSPNISSKSRWEHPRVCGENLLCRPNDMHKDGTSPRMRGKLPRSAAPPLGRRNIPAYAGKTGGFPPRYLRYRGTSPRMRGKPSKGVGQIRVRRNIPAYAGKTAWCAQC